MPRTLHYSQRDAYVRGLDDILARPALTLEQEFSRKARRAAPPAPRAQLPATYTPPPHVAAQMGWTDWKGASHTVKAEWKYVNGAAYASDGTLAGPRAPATPPRRAIRAAPTEDPRGRSARKRPLSPFCCSRQAPPACATRRTWA